MEGLFLPVEVNLPAAVRPFPRLAHAGTTEAVHGKALVDTGTRLTCVRREIVALLGALRVTTTIGQTSGGSVSQGVFLLSFRIPDLDLGYDGVRIPEVILDGYTDDVIAIIGRDLLSQWHLTWHGPDGAWSVST
jgi:hypothetical protein